MSDIQGIKEDLQDLIASLSLHIHLTYLTIPPSKLWMYASTIINELAILLSVHPDSEHDRSQQAF